VLAVLGPASVAQEDDGIPPPQVFRGAATSLVASVAVDRDALIPVQDLFRFIALDGEAVYESSNQLARASVLFPGNGLVSGPALLCGTFGARFPPELEPVLDACLQYRYPLTVTADSGLDPDVATVGALSFGGDGDVVSGHVVRAAAHAAADATVTDAVVSDLRLLGLPPFGPVALPIPGFDGLDTSLLTIDGATSRTDQRIVAGDLVVDSKATLSGVRLVGGLVRIASIESHARVVDARSAKPVTDTTFEVSGVTVAGVPARVTDEGLVLGEPGGSTGPIAQQASTAVNELVTELGLSITALPVDEHVDPDGVASARVGGLEVRFERELQGAPGSGPLGDLDPNGVYSGGFVLGSSGAQGIAASFDDDVADVAPSLDAPIAGGTGPVLSDPSLVPDTGGAPGAGPAPAAPGTTRVVRRFVGFVDELFADRLRLVYLAFTLTALGLCIAPRLTMPARFPSAGP
jgi:hypothetical protein